MQTDPTMDLLQLPTVVGLSTLVFSLVGGWLSDRYGRRPVMVVPRALAARVVIPELFPRHIRAVGMSIAYALGVAVFGGTTQFIITWLIGASGNPAAPALYVAATSALSALGMYLLSESRYRTLQRPGAALGPALLSWRLPVR